MKKVISLILCVLLVFPLFSVFSSAADEKCDCGRAPIIRVCGLGATILDPQGEALKAADAKTIISTVLKAIPLLPGLLNGRLTAREAERFVGIAEGFFTELALDENGDAPEGQRVNFIYPLTIEHENGRPINFEYDWRLDPFDSAEKLYDFIEYVKKMTGHDSVYLVGESMGTIIMNTYLAVHGFDGIDGVMWYNGGYKGILTCSDSFSNQNTLSADAMGAYLRQVAVNADSGVLYDLFSALADSGFFGEVFEAVAKSAYGLNDDGYLQSFLVRTIGRFPGLWSFVKYEDFDAAVDYAFPSEALRQQYAGLIERITRYHNEVSGKADELMAQAEEITGKVGVVCGYGSLLPPVTHEEYLQSDGVISTREESGGATCAPVGETLGADYTQKNADGHDHISPDGAIDASTCFFPDKTWFIKYGMHRFSEDGYSGELIRAVFFSDEPFTVFSDADFPQYMILEKDESTLLPLTEQTDEVREMQTGFGYKIFKVFLKIGLFFLRGFQKLTAVFRG